MQDKIYCYPDSEVLINRLGIQGEDRLMEVERRLTMIRLMELLREPIVGGFNLPHLCSIHRYIFQDLYDWAGEIRQVNIAKGINFCLCDYIAPSAEKIFSDLRKENFLRSLPFAAFVNRMSYYFAEINALHPFREGNGRAQREFARTLALYNGYQLKFSLIPPEEMIRASIDSIVCDYRRTEDMFRRCLRKN